MLHNAHIPHPNTPYAAAFENLQKLHTLVFVG